MSSRELKTEVLVIGNGIAGLSCAIRLAKLGIESVVVSAAENLTESNTARAQGGIIYQANAHDREKLIQDIVEAGCHINYMPAVEQLARLGPSLVKNLLMDEGKTPFDRNDKNEYQLTREGGHSEGRIVYRGDETGHAIEESLFEYAKSLRQIHFLKSHTAVNLLMTSFHCSDRSARHSEAECFGAFVFDQSSSEVYPIFSKRTVLATGGIGQLYLHNTNSKFSRGDGIAMAYRAGCRLENLEYVQFHPTTFFHATARRFLISEALRGEGAVLLNQAGERFMFKYLPTYSTPELAPRDRVARAIHDEMLSTGAPCVYLDISHKPKEWVKERFPFVWRSCKKYGIDITEQPIPVVPGAHYHCGGVWTDLSGKTSVKNLFAVGEVACTGLHGANRLASTSLLEGLVWGTQASEKIQEELKSGVKMEFPKIDPWKHERAHVDPAFLTQDWLTLRNTMWNYVGLVKTDARLLRAEGILHELTRGIESFYRNAVLSDELIGLRHASLAALLILEASQRNTKNLGCYLRDEIEI